MSVGAGVGVLTLAVDVIWPDEGADLTVVYEDGGDGWIMARIPELPGVISQGRTRDEARFMVRDALREMLLAWAQVGSPPPEPLPADADTESLELVIAP